MVEFSGTCEALLIVGARAIHRNSIDSAVRHSLSTQSNYSSSSSSHNASSSSQDELCVDVRFDRSDDLSEAALVCLNGNNFSSATSTSSSSSALTSSSNSSSQSYTLSSLAASLSDQYLSLQIAHARAAFECADWYYSFSIHSPRFRLANSMIMYHFFTVKHFHPFFSSSV